MPNFRTRTSSTDTVTVTVPSPCLGGAEKLAEVTRLIHVLEVDLTEKNLLPPQRNATLEELKIYTREIKDAEPLATERGMSVLCRHSFDGNSFVTARSALKCLANVMLLEASTRQIFVDLGYAPKAVERLKHDNREDEFLASRLLFLCTYDTNLDFDGLFAHDQLADIINSNIARHSKHFTKATPKGLVPPADVLALSESLKLLFNITQFYPHQARTLTKSLLPILKIITHVPIPSPPLQPPVTYLINALLNLDLEDKRNHHFTMHNNPLFPSLHLKANVECFTRILDRAVRAYKDEELEQLLTPLVTLLRKIFEFAPDPVKSYMETYMLPSDEERVKPLGQSKSLSSLLLHLSSSAVAPNLREAISTMMFELSGKDATSFVRNVGYGFASGFLMTHDMPIPESALEAWSTGEGLEQVSNVNGMEVNPITGQRRDMEAVDNEVEMTAEEKEREAERLFVLFERLRATGVVNVENPVTKALQEGRFEEIE